MSEKNNLILASNSPRRQQLLSLGGWSFNVLSADVDESQHPGEAPGDYVLRLAKDKARTAAEKAEDDKIVIAADTAVVDAGEILGKPVDGQDAVGMLERLRGHTHQVYTGLALLRVSDKALLTDLSITDVRMRAYSDEEIEAYVHTGDPLDKAGAYAIQHPRFQPVANIQGCYASVMGLQLCRLASLMEQFDITPHSPTAIRCQGALQDECAVYTAVLRREPVKPSKGDA